MYAGEASDKKVKTGSFKMKINKTALEKKIQKNFLQSAIKIGIIAIMAVLFYVLSYLFLHGFLSYPDAGFIHSFATVAERIFLAALSVLFFCLLYHILGLIFNKCSDKAIGCFNLLMWILFFSLQAYFLFYIRSYYKWDSGFVIGAAASLAEQGSIVDEAFYYMSIYPNQNFFVFLTAVLVRFSDFLGISVANRPILFNLFNTLLIDLSLVFFLSLLKRFHKTVIFGKRIKSEHERKAAMCRIRFILFCNPFLYLGVSYYYTITLSWIFTMGFLFLLFSDSNQKEKIEKKWFQKQSIRDICKWILAGILLGAGYELRATAVIYAIAVLILVSIRLLTGEREKKRLLKKTVMIALAAILSFAFIHAALKDFVKIDTTDTAFPVTHWVMMSLTPPGGHNAEDEAFTASFSTKEEKQTAVKERMKDKLQEMGIGGYVKLVRTKITRTFGDGMNGYTTFLADGYGTGKLYDSLFGNHKDLFVLWHQGYYLFMLLGILMSIVAVIKMTCRQDSFFKKTYQQLFYLLVTLFGAILFYVFWEASEQYSVPFMPIMMFLGFSGMLCMEDGCLEMSVGERRQTGKVKFFGIQNQLSRCLGTTACIAALLFTIWGIFRFPTFVNMPFHQSQTLATQILANEPLLVDDGETLIQNLSLNGSCNHLVIQWRNPTGAENDSVYEVVFGSRDGEKIYLCEQIIASQSGYNGAGIYDFERVIPEKDSAIFIRKVEGSPDSDLLFVCYNMYGYTPYPGGSLDSIKSGQDVVKTDASLLFLLSDEKEESYAETGQYIFFVTCIFLVFLFMGICCKIEKIGLFQRAFKSYGN